MIMWLMGRIKVCAFPLLLVYTSFTWSAEFKESIKIGCLFPMSGPSAIYGEDSIAAIRIAEEELKEKRLKQQKNSTVLKNASVPAKIPSKIPPTIKVLVGDTKSKPLRAVQLARSFIENDSVKFLCGGVSSSVALAVTKVAHTKRIIFVGTDHASPRLVDEAFHPYYFRMNNGTRQSMRAGAKYIAQHYKKRRSPLKIAFIGPDYDYGYRAWDDLRYFLKKEGVAISIVVELWPKLNQKDFSIYIDALIDAKPDIVVNGHWGSDFVDFIRQAKDSDVLKKSTLMNFDAGGNYDTLVNVGDDMPLGLVLSARHHVNWPPTVENKTFVDKFFRRTGRYPSYAAEGAYAGVHAIAAVVDNVGKNANDGKLIAAFQKLSLKLPEDPDGFKSYMDPSTHQIQQVQAIGVTINSQSHQPATVLLGNWSVYYP